MTTSDLFIDKGTVIHATRDFKSLNFKEILEEHEIQNAERYIPPDPHVGGWNKFVKDNITNHPDKRKRVVGRLLKKGRKSSN